MSWKLCFVSITRAWVIIKKTGQFLWADVVDFCTYINCSIKIHTLVSYPYWIIEIPPITRYGKQKHLGYKSGMVLLMKNNRDWNDRCGVYACAIDPTIVVACVATLLKKVVEFSSHCVAALSECDKNNLINFSLVN